MGVQGSCIGVKETPEIYVLSPCNQGIEGNLGS